MIAIGIVNTKFDLKNGQFYEHKGTYAITFTSSCYTKYNNGSSPGLRYFLTGIKQDFIMTMTLDMIKGVLIYKFNGKELSIGVDVEQEYIMAFSLIRQQKIQLLQ